MQGPGTLGRACCIELLLHLRTIAAEQNISRLKKKASAQEMQWHSA